MKLVQDSILYYWDNGIYFRIIPNVRRGSNEKISMKPYVKKFGFFYMPTKQSLVNGRGALRFSRTVGVAKVFKIGKNYDILFLLKKKKGGH